MLQFYYLQRNVVGDSLGFDEVFNLMLGNDMPADSIVETVLEQHSPVSSVNLVQSRVTAVCLWHAPNLQHKHDLAAIEIEIGLESVNSFLAIAVL